MTVTLMLHVAMAAFAYVLFGPLFAGSYLAGVLLAMWFSAPSG